MQGKIVAQCCFKSHCSTHVDHFLFSWSSQSIRKLHHKVEVCSSTSFLHHQRPHVPPAEVEGHLAAQTLQQVLRSVFQVERALVLQDEKTGSFVCVTREYHMNISYRHHWDLYGEDEHSTPGHHVEEEDHGFILVGGVGVKYPLGHHVTLRHTQKTVTDLFELSDLTPFN